VTAVEEAITAAGHVIVDMAVFAASGQASSQVCAEMVRGCDVYVGVLGTRYGSPVRDKPEVSYTELEFHTAVEAGLDRLVFLLDTEADEVGIPASALIDREFGDRQDAFRRRVQDSGLLIRFFSNPDALGQLVERSLRDLARARRRAVGGSLPAPPRPELFCARSGLHRRVRGLIEADSGGRAPVVAMVGMGGSGKTLLAQAIADDEDVKTRFPDGVLWLDVSDTTEAVCQATVLAALGVSAPGGSVTARKTALRQRLSGARCLLILDDVACVVQITALDVLGPGSALLITTRDQDTLPHGTHICPVGAFELADPREHAVALSLLAQYAVGTPELPPTGAEYAEEVVDRCGGLPLALAICGAMVSGGYSWASVATLLREADLDALRAAFRDYPHPSLLAAIAVGTDNLDERTLSLYEELAVFNARGPVPVGAAASLWSPHGLDADHALRTVVFLAHRSQLTYRPDSSTFLLHDLQYDYLSWRVGQRLSGLHGRLADTYLGAWGGLEDGLPGLNFPETLSADMRYGLVHLPDHLVRADRGDQLDTLLAAEARSGIAGSGNVWFDAHDRIGRAAEYLADIDLASGRAQKVTDGARTPAERSLGIGLEVRYALVRSSLASIAGKIPARLLTSLVHQDVWSIDQARAYATMIPADDDRAAALTGLAGLLTPGTSDRAQLISLARQAAAGIRYDMYRAFAYARIAVVSPEEDRSSLFDQAVTAADADSARAGEIRAWLQTYVAPYDPQRAAAELRRGARSDHHAKDYCDAMTAVLADVPDLREDVLETARGGYFRGERGGAFGALLRCAQPDQIAGLVTEIKSAIDREDEQWRQEELAVAVAPYLSGEELHDLVTRLIDGASPHTIIDLMAAALPHLPHDKQQAAASVAIAAVREAGPNIGRESLAALLPAIPEPDRTTLLEEIIQQVHDRHPASAEWLLCELAPMLPEHLLRRAVDNTGAVNPPDKALNRLAPHLPPELLRRALATQPLDPPAEWAKAFVHLAPALPSTMRKQIIELVSAIKDIPRRLELLSRLAPCLPPELAAAAADAVPADAEPEPRAQLLAALASRASEPQRSALYGQARHVADSDDHPHARFRSLIRMTDGPEQLAAVLRLQCVLDDFFNRHIRCDSLTEAVPVPTAVIDHAVEAVRTIERPCDRSRALAMLVPLVTTTSRPALLKEAAEGAFRPHAHEDDIPCDALNALQKAISTVSVAARLPLAREVTKTLVRSKRNTERLRQLICLAVYQSRLNENRQMQALRCIEELSSTRYPDWVRRHGTRGFSRLVPYLSPDRMLDAVRLARALEKPYEQAQALANLADHADAGVRPLITEATIQEAKSSRACPRAEDNDGIDDTWSARWRTALHKAASAGRPALLSLIATMPITTAADLAAEERSSTAAHITLAMFDTRHWWPTGP